MQQAGRAALWAVHVRAVCGMRACRLDLPHAVGLSLPQVVGQHARSSSMRMVHAARMLPNSLHLQPMLLAAPLPSLPPLFVALTQ